MKTNDLIETIVLDGSALRPSLPARMSTALVAGGAVAAILFVSTLGVRPDIGSAVETWRFVFKVALTMICFLFAWLACVQLARPEVSLGHVIGGLAVAPAMLSVAVGYELMTLPPVEWYVRTAGRYAGTCLIAIPLLSLLPLAAADGVTCGCSAGSGSVWRRRGSISGRAWGGILRNASP